MKIAIFLCGLCRSYEETHQSFHHAFSDYDYDCFLHTWNLSEKSIRNSSNSVPLDQVKPNEETLKKLFKLKKIKIEEQISENIPGILPDSTDPYPNNAVCFHESVKRCMSLCENPQLYDFCVITRPDIFYHEKIKISTIERNSIVVPYINNLYENKNIIQKMKRENPNSINDMLYNALAFGSFDDLMTFANFADDYVDLCKNNTDFLVEGKVNYLPDRAFAIYVKILKNIKVIEQKIKHGIMRQHKNIQMYSW